MPNLGVFLSNRRLLFVFSMGPVSMADIPMSQNPSLVVFAICTKTKLKYK